MMNSLHFSLPCSTTTLFRCIQPWHWFLSEFDLSPVMLHRHCYLLESLANQLCDIFWFSFRTANWIMYLPITRIDIDFIPCTICSQLMLLLLIIFLACRWLLIGLFSFVSSIRELLNSVGCVRLSETILPISTSIVIKEIVLIWLHLKAYNCILIHGSNNLKLRQSFPFGRFVPDFTYFSSLHQHKCYFNWIVTAPTSCRKPSDQWRISMVWWVWSRKCQNLLFWLYIMPS